MRTFAESKFDDESDTQVTSASDVGAMATSSLQSAPPNRSTLQEWLGDTTWPLGIRSTIARCTAQAHFTEWLGSDYDKDGNNLFFSCDGLRSARIGHRAIYFTWHGAEPLTARFGVRGQLAPIHGETVLEDFDEHWSMTEEQRNIPLWLGEKPTRKGHVLISEDGTRTLLVSLDSRQVTLHAGDAAKTFSTTRKLVAVLDQLGQGNYSRAFRDNSFDPAPYIPVINQ